MFSFLAEALQARIDLLLGHVDAEAGRAVLELCPVDEQDEQTVAGLPTVRIPELCRLPFALRLLSAVLDCGLELTFRDHATGDKGDRLRLSAAVLAAADRERGDEHETRR